jgi:hypothetical protein
MSQEDLAAHLDWVPQIQFDIEFDIEGRIVG